MTLPRYSNLIWHLVTTPKMFWNANGVHVLPKEANPPNCPQLRPIERYWAFVERELSQYKQQATTIEQFRKSWTKAAKSVAEKSAQTLMAGSVEVLSRTSLNK